MTLDVEQANGSLPGSPRSTSAFKKALTASPPGRARLQIVARDLGYSVQVKERKKGEVTKHILKDVNAVLEPQRTIAVMGASGAGKTTFLNVVAGFAKAKGVSGSITVNGEDMDGAKMRRVSGFVHQEDVILSTMTVREALVFAAMLKLPGSVPRPQKVARALSVARLLSLGACLDSLVGDSLTKGISGGEKRRLSVGMEMVTEPAVLFLDEPSSGLDAFNAFKVVHILRSVAHHHGRTVVFTIHQPSSEVFHLFDDLLVLAAGQVVYLGPAEGMVEWFASLGYRCPTYTNPADYLFMEILNASRFRAEEGSDASLQGGGGGAGGSRSADGAAIVLPPDPAAAALAPAGPAAATAAGRGLEAGDPGARDVAAEAEAEAGTEAEAEDARIEGLIAAWKKSPQAMRLLRSFRQGGALEDSGIAREALTRHAPFWLQLLLLCSRAARNAVRNPLVLRGKLGQTVFLSLVVGLIFLNVSDDLTGVQDRLGSLFFLIVQGMFGSVMGVLTVFGAEKVVFQREYGNGMYGLPAYFLSRWLVEAPLHIILPVMSACIVYWMIGYQNEPDKFGWFALTMVLMDACGAGLGIFISCLFNDLSMALSVAPMFLLPLMVFSGFFVNSKSIPPYFTWIQYISPMRYGFVAVSVNEFTGLQINCTPQQECAPGYDGEAVIANLGFADQGGPPRNTGILFAILVGLLGLAYVALWGAVRRLGK
ncbi:hypothetical protein HYH03_002951 [Edaphochlamys debaryana]|uniref:ABC transporter domain-containing protein n=1 Tax=Edaphochlamys debaryana TaxID=47281 RepID=A0A836C3R2_9CHLO|nr:hypothetical protein HYH03_002951 [Edaphochlamys debaryana]|eukprot:KAG2499376.1 hypothetical protein HYH03_002951 [Edaphochlamys debaryana]